MLKRMVLLCLILGGCVCLEDKVLGCFYGSTGLNRLTVCFEDAVDCEAALWRPRWVLTRSSCFYEIPLWQLAVIKSNKGCADYFQDISSPPTSMGWNKTRRVYAIFQHPSNQVDLSLLYLDEPFEAVETLANNSATQEVLTEYEPWLKKTVHTYLYGNSRAKWSGEVASPTRMFVIAGVLPSAALIVFFLFTLFFTNPKQKHISEPPCHFKKDSSV